MFRASTLRRASAALFLCGVAPLACAKTFYVDALNGNDAWSGELPNPGKDNGPWQTLANLAPMNRLKPGDVVLLRCGHKWAETLRIESSGTSLAPIRVGAYPEPCADKPAIDGAKRIPSEAWTLHAGNVYKTRLPFDLIHNGAFDSTFSGWRRWSQNNDAQMTITPSCPESTASCLAFTSGTVGSSLLISNPFKVESFARYRVKFSIRAPAGSSYGVSARRFSAPWSLIGGPATTLQGNGVWQTVSLPFTSAADIDNARLDIQIYQPNTTVHVRDVQVMRDEPAPASLVQITDQGEAQRIAHHPNRGHNPAAPDSIYLVTPSPSSTFLLPNGRRSSNFLVTGSDLVLPPGATIEPGQRVVLRSQAWSLSEHTVTGVSGSRVHLEPNTGYPLQHSGWGYYLTGALWMLDSPGEWHYDRTTQTLYVWSDSGRPTDRFAYSTLDRGIDIGRRNVDIGHVVIEDIAVRNVRDGAYVQRARNVALRRVEIENAARYGIDGEGTVDLELTDSRIANTGSDALFGPAALNTLARNNDILNSGVVLDVNGKPRNLPLPSYGALHAGANARMIDNRLRNLSFIGISVGNNSEVRSNAVENFCYLLNDCAGIYLGGTDGVRVMNNLVNGGSGDRNGIPKVIGTLVDALYLDGGSANTVVQDNTLAGGDYAIQLHNGNNNRIERNTLYGSRANLLWLQENGNDKRSSGNIFGNVIVDNAFFPTASAPALNNVAKVENTADFAVYQGNVYSTLISPVIAMESGPMGARSYQFPDWQAAKDPLGAARNLDADGRIGAPLAGFARGTLGSTLVVNGNLTDGAVGWSRHSSGTPAATLAVQSCPPAGNCLLMTAGASNASLSSPRFGVVEGQWYRVSFDAQVGESGQPIVVQAIRSGPDSYASVMGAEPNIFSGSTTLKRYHFTFKATATVPRTATLPGVRVDFMDVKPGQTLRVANFEVVPLALAGGNADHALLQNPGRGSINVACPTENSAPASCANFYRFPQGDRVVWPVTLAPLAAQLVFMQDRSLADSDHDGVADNQDNCPGTPRDTSVNARGCGLGQ